MRHLLSKLLSWDFVRMGKGIESRHARCAPFWEPHLSCTRSFIEKHAQSGGRLAILGAGRLLDVDLKKLIPHYSEVHLFDADPTVLRVWRKTSGIAFRQSVAPRILDVTGSLSSWTAGLIGARKQGRLATYLTSLEPSVGAWQMERFDGVISLNLIGQIPIYWRDRVLQVAGDLTEEESCALLTSMEKLQAAHLQALRTSPQGWAIAITDTEYYTYDVDRSDWEVEPALYGNVHREFLAPTGSMTQSGDDCWLWHLVPQFIESESEGHIHRVEAKAWSNSAY